MSSDNLEIKDILKNIDGDWLTRIMYPYDDEAYDEVMLLNITKEDLSSKNHDNVHQVGYKAPYGDDDEVLGLIYFYFKQCVQWYGHKNMPWEKEGISLKEAAKKEAELTIKDQKDSPHITKQVLLYCEGTFVWCLGGC